MAALTESAAEAKPETGARRLFSRWNWKIALLSLALGAVLLAIRFDSLSRRSWGLTGERTQDFTLATLPLQEVKGLAIDTAKGTIECREADASFAVTRSTKTPQRGICGFAISLKPQKPFVYDNVLLNYAEAWSPYQFFDTNNSHVRVLRGMVEEADGAVTISWNLPMLASRCRIELPANAAFEVTKIQITHSDDGFPAGTVGSILRCAPLLLPGLAIALVAMILQLGWARRPLDTIAIKRILLLEVAFSAGVLLFVLPPFQGPDEWRHWKTMLRLYRKDAEAELPLFNLHETLHAERLNFRSENQFQPMRLRGLPPAEGAFWRTWWVSYGNGLTYLTSAPVLLLFPRTESVSEALILYYLCRFVPLALLFVMLFAINARGWLAFTAIVFFSSPLVLQQFTAISSDTVANLGALLAGYLYLRHHEQPTVKSLTLLSLVCLTVALVKPVVFVGMLLLPLLCLRREQLPGRRTLLSLGALFLFVVGLMAVKGVTLIRSQLADEDLGRKWVFLATGQGAAMVASALAVLLEKLTAPHNWFLPLGWLDTFFNDRHVTFIKLTVWLGLFLDLLHWGPSVVKGLVLRHPVRAASLLAVLAAIALILVLSACFVLYMSPITAMKITSFEGFQVRYLFPVAILALLLPLSLMSLASRDPGVDGPPTFKSALVGGLACGLLPLLLFVREVELSTDMFIRYW